MLEMLLPDGRIACLVPLLFGRSRITVGRGTSYYDEGW
jgi:hypothetical protein